MAEAYIKLYKKMLKWEWYDDPNTFRVFMHCLLKANWKSGSWHGIEYEPGEFITSLPTLAQQTCLTIQQVRTALDHLKSTGEITDKRHGNARIITVLKWNEYQCDNRPSNSLSTDLQQTFNRPSTADKEYKDIQEYKNINNTNAREEIILGIYHNVRLTQDELQELINQYPDDYKDMIDNLSTYMRSKGKLYDDHFATMMRWKHEDQEKAKQKPVNKRRNLIEEIRNA